MVNANSYPTRTRIENGVDGFTETSFISRKHRFVAQRTDIDRRAREGWITSVKANVEQLSPATKRVLLALKAALDVRYYEGRGYRWLERCNRLDIAAELDRAALVPYDIRMLRKLVKRGLIVERKRALPVRTFTGADGTQLQMGAGFEFVYSISPDVMYGLLYLDPVEQQRLDALAPRRTDEPAHKAQQNESVNIGGTMFERDPVSGFYIGQKPPTLWERIAELFGF